MIDSVIKNPDLTSEQAKYIKYEVSYQNGESIASKQLLAKKKTMPIKKIQNLVEKVNSL